MMDAKCQASGKKGKSSYKRTYKDQNTNTNSVKKNKLTGSSRPARMGGY